MPLCFPERFSSNRTISWPVRNEAERSEAGEHVGGRFALSQRKRSDPAGIALGLATTAEGSRGDSTCTGLDSTTPTGGCAESRWLVMGGHPGGLDHGTYGKAAARGVYAIKRSQRRLAVTSGGNCWPTSDRVVQILAVHIRRTPDARGDERVSNTILPAS